MNPAAPGWRTTEFWLTLGVHFLTLLISSGVLPAESVWVKVATLLLSALSQFSYNASRAQVKAAAMDAEAVASADAALKAGGTPKQNWPSNAVLLLIATSLLLSLAGCAAFRLPSPDYVKADRATYEAVAPEYSAYVAADPLLDAEQIARRQRTVATWRRRLESAEKSAPATQPARQ